MDKCRKGCLCEHNIRKQNCKDCKGSQICEHNRQKQNCKDCKGSQICEHNKRKQFCKECKGSQMCVHDRIKLYCKECKGSRICEHNLIKYQCKDCSGGAFYEHNNKKRNCKKCKGINVCEHNKLKDSCIECGGSRICEHKTWKLVCVICHPEKACQNCFQIHITSKYRFKPYCFRCYCIINPDADIPRQYKLKEHHLRDEIIKAFPDSKLIFDKKIDGGCSGRRPDVRIECLTHTVIIECDENQHKSTSCEDKRTMELFQDLGNRPIVMIRFNPDKYDDVEGCFKHTKSGWLSLEKKEWNKRIDLLNDVIQKYCTESAPEKEVTIEYLYYNSS